MNVLPPFLESGSALPLRVLRYRGESRWWCSPGEARALHGLLRCALGRRWPLSAAIARLVRPAAHARWARDVAHWVEGLGLPAAPRLAAQLGSPGRYRKYVAIAIAAGHRPMWVLKASCSFDSRASILAEASALSTLASAMPAGLKVPHMYGTAEIDGVVYSVQEACLPLPSARVGEWTDRHRRFCGALFTSAGSSSGDLHTALASREALRAKLDALGGEARRLAGTCARLLALADSELAGRPVRLGWVHRDFTPWNTMPVSGALTVVDWEWAQPGWVPLHDAFHFHLFPDILRGEIDPAQWERLVGDESPLAGLARDLGIHGALTPYAALYLYDTLIFYGDALASDGKSFDDSLLQRMRRLAEAWAERHSTMLPSGVVA